MQLDLGLLIAGAKERGELESRVTGLLSEIRAAGDVVLMCAPGLASWRRHFSRLCQSCSAICNMHEPTSSCCIAMWASLVLAARHESLCSISASLHAAIQISRMLASGMPATAALRPLMQRPHPRCQHLEDLYSIMERSRFQAAGAVSPEGLSHCCEHACRIDEIHMLVGAGAGSRAGGSGLDISNLLKPPLARGELQCIGATTLDEHRKYIEKDAALERRFQPVMVAEPTQAETLEILHGLQVAHTLLHKLR